MKKKRIIDAWRDEDYYLSLSPAERAALPEHPAGITGLEDEALRSISGGCAPTFCWFNGCSRGTTMCSACGGNPCA